MAVAGQNSAADAVPGKRGYGGIMDVTPCWQPGYKYSCLTAAWSPPFFPCMNLWFLLALQDSLRSGWKGADVPQTTPKAQCLGGWDLPGLPARTCRIAGRVCNGDGLTSPEKHPHNKLSLTKFRSYSYF